MFHFNLLQRPIERETIDAWAKVLEDLAKVAILATPVVLYGDKDIWFKLGHLALLAAMSYIGFLLAKLLRKNRRYFEGE